MTILCVTLTNIKLGNDTDQSNCGVKTNIYRGNEYLFEKQATGKKLFKSVCAQFHNTNMWDKFIVPALDGCFRN